MTGRQSGTDVRDRDYFKTKSKPFWQSSLNLIGHLAGTAVIFSSFLGIVWSVSWLLAYLNSIHAFPKVIYGILTNFEVYLVYADIAVCGYVVLAGAWRFCRDITEGV
ncbi:MAG: hypothetical protein ABI644_10175 [Arenimonas sp.]